MTTTQKTTQPLQFTVADSVKARIEADSHERGTSINNVVIGVIAAHYRVPFEPTARKGGGGSGSPTMNVPLPVKVYERVARDAIMRTKQEVVERILCAHYGIDYDGRVTPA